MKIIIWLLLGLFCCSCGRNRLRIPQEAAISGLASPIYRIGDTLICPLADYFSQPAKVGKISWSDGVAKYIESDTLLLLAKGPGKVLSDLQIHYEGYDYNIPVIRSDRRSDSIQILTDCIIGDTIFVSSVLPVTAWNVYFENYKLDSRYFLSYSENRLGICIPEEAAVLKYGKLRIWADNGVKVSSELILPVVEGKIALRFSDIDTTDRAVVAWQQKMNSYKSNRDPNVSELECLLALRADNRMDVDTSRLKPEVTALSEPGLHQLFKNSVTLMYGDYIPLRIQKQVFAYLRSYFGKEWIIIVNKAPDEMIFKLELPQKWRETNFKSLFGNRFSYGNARLIVDVPAYGIEVVYNEDRQKESV